MAALIDFFCLYSLSISPSYFFLSNKSPSNTPSSNLSLSLCTQQLRPRLHKRLDSSTTLFSSTIHVLSCMISKINQQSTSKLRSNLQSSQIFFLLYQLFNYKSRYTSSSVIYSELLFILKMSEWFCFSIVIAWLFFISYRTWFPA